tara:strand:- start:465 stop:1640 length:1176 start_codon:yes stop_codon:yes gene_type:complete
MKILHINGTSSGGAYNVVYNLHKNLLNKNLDSFVLLPKKKNIKNEFIFDPNSLTQKLKLLLSKIIIKCFPRGNQTSTLGIFHSNQIAKVVKKIKPDVIHLHWVGNEILSLNQILNYKIPIIITLHDMWFFLPYRHYAIEGPSNENLFSKFVSILLVNQKKKLNTVNSKFVVTSEWMKKKTIQSQFYSNKKITKIPIGIDFKYWFPEDKNYSKNFFSFENEKTIILFTAMGPNNFRKGIDIFYESLKHLNFDYKIVVSSDVEINYKNFKNFIYIKNLNDIKKRRILYSACDILAAPSRLEAFGLTALEASSCNLPSVVFKNTGFEEIIQNKKNGYTAEFLDVNDFANGINWISDKISENPSYFNSCRQLVKKKFDVNNFTDNYINLYKNSKK